jgi:hypothetical protein
MAQITGTITIDFMTDKPINQDDFKKFRKELNKSIEDFEMAVFDAASESGFEANSIQPIFLDYLECDFEEEDDDFE